MTLLYAQPPVDLGDAVDRRVYLVESLLSTTYPPGVPLAPASWQATGGFPTAGRDLTAASSSPQLPLDLRLANDTFITAANDPDRPSQAWDGRVRNPGVMSRSAKLTPVEAAAVEVSGGTIVIDNTDGYFDTLLDRYYAVSQEIAIRIGRHGMRHRDFQTLWQMRITGIGLSETELTFEVADPTHYAQNLYPVSYYTGAGGIDGSTGLDDVQRPVVLGRVWNWSPVLIDPVLLIYQLHDGEVQVITDVFDGGVPLPFDQDYPTYAQLAAATVPAGRYASCIASGVLRLRDEPAFTVTAHLVGHAAAGGTVRSIATFLAGELDTGLGIGIDVPSFQALPPAPAGWGWTDAFSYQDAMNRFVGDVGWLWGALTIGPLSCGQLQPPDPALAPARRFRSTDILDLERVSLPAGYESTHKRQVVSYRKNWTVQSRSELAQGPTVEERGARQREWKSVTANATTVARNAIDPPVIETSLVNADDARALATYLIALHGARRRMFSLETAVFGLLPSIGAQVNLIYPRFGLGGNGEPFRLLDIEQDLGAGRMTLLLWG